MSEYLVLNYPGDGVQTDAAWELFFAEATRAGNLIGGSPLGAAVGFDRSGTIPTTAPPIGGYFIFRADDRATVERLMARCPVITGGGRVDIIELLPE